MSFWSDILKAKTRYFPKWNLQPYNITTAERTAITALIGLKESALRVWDTDLKAWLTWDGVAWLQESSGGSTGYGNGEILDMGNRMDGNEIFNMGNRV